MDTIKISILTVSDRGARGERQDTSGPAIAELIKPLGVEIISRDLVSDDRKAIAAWLRHCCDKHDCDIILTTGGTGLGPRDLTPEATLDVIDRPAPGIPEAMRARSLDKTPMAMLSRAVAGIRGRTLIVNLPGSERAVRECLAIILPALKHAAEMLRGEGGDCGSDPRP